MGKLINFWGLLFFGSMGKDLFYLIFRNKPARVLLALLESDGQDYASSLAKKADCTFPHIVKILAEFKQYKLIEITSKGRIKPIVLTPVGKTVSSKLRELSRLCEGN